MRRIERSLLTWCRGARQAAPLALLAVALPATATAVPIRAAYTYSYMSLGHLDSLAAAGFNRAVVKTITDSLGTRGVTEFRLWMDRGTRLGVTITPQWHIPIGPRMASLGSIRRYTWGAQQTVENDVGCPLDSVYWRDAIINRAQEILAISPSIRTLAIDLETYAGTRTHYDGGPCQCGPCLAEYAAHGSPRSCDARARWNLPAYEEARLTRLFTSLLTVFAARHPGVELGAFDLDYDSFVHRALARALASTRIPTVNYTERTYSLAGSAVAAARTALTSVGLDAPVVGGVWLKRYTPDEVGPVVQSILANAEGYFVFTTYSLWIDPAHLTGPYILPGERIDYWNAFGRANR